MSVYNGEFWVRNAIESVLDQTYPDFEFLVINDGSYDKTSSIINSYSDSRIRIIEQENKGLTQSLNIGLNKAKGHYIARIDADDICEPHRLEFQKLFMDENLDVALVGSNFTMISGSGNLIRDYKCPTLHEGIIEKLHNFEPIFPHSSIFFRKKIVLKENGYNERFFKSQDSDLYLRISSKYKIACINKSLVKIRLNEVGITYSDENQLLYGLAALICHFRRQAGTLDFSKIDVENNKEWELFLLSIRSWLSKNRTFELFKLKGKARSLYNKFNFRKLLSLVKLLMQIIKSNPKSIFTGNKIKDFSNDLKYFIEEYEH